jgi:hypothetical protein
VYRSTRPSPVLAAALVGALVVLAAVVAPALFGRRTAEPGPPLGAVLDAPDRRELDATPVRRGDDAAPVDPAVDLTDPPAVARAYLAAARSTSVDDRGRTHLRAAAYAEPRSPPAAVGVVVLEPPQPGQVRTAAVTALELVATDEADRRRGYHATVTSTTGPPRGPAVTDVSTAYVVLARQPDGRWLVAADTTDTDDTGSG